MKTKLEVIEISLALMVVVVSWVSTYPKLIKLYILNARNFLCVNHTPIKELKKLIHK